MAGLCATLASGSGLADTRVTKGRKLVVFGNACRDTICQLATFPRPGETLVADSVTEDLGGKGLNQAIAAHRVGAEVRLIAPIGTDQIATEIQRLLRREGLSAQWLIEHEGTSDSSLIMVVPGGENAIVSNARLIRSITPDRAVASIAATTPDAVLMQGNASLETTRALAKSCRNCHVPIILNAAPFVTDLPSLAADLDVVIVNQLEAAAWTGCSDPAEAGPKIGCELVVVTLGARGCLLSRDGGPAQLINAHPVESIDTTGAGDVFTGVLVGEWMQTGDFNGAAKLAVLAAGDKVARRGTISAFPSRAGVDALRLRLKLSA
jgi:ribokinase